MLEILCMALTLLEMLCNALTLLNLSVVVWDFMARLLRRCCIEISVSCITATSACSRVIGIGDRGKVADRCGRCMVVGSWGRGMLAAIGILGWMWGRGMSDCFPPGVAMFWERALVWCPCKERARARRRRREGIGLAGGWGWGAGFIHFLYRASTPTTSIP